MLDLCKMLYRMLDEDVIIHYDDSEVDNDYTACADEFYYAVIRDVVDYCDSLDRKPTVYDVAEYLEEMFESADDDTIMFMGLDWDKIDFSIWEDCQGGINNDSRYFEQIINELEYLDVDIDRMDIGFTRAV